MGSTTAGEERTGKAGEERGARPGPTGADRIARDTERLLRAHGAAARDAGEAAERAAAGWPDLIGTWSADGRSLTRLGLEENLRAGDRLIEDWRQGMEAQRAALDAMRDLMRRQQDMALASTQALLSAFTLDRAAPGSSAMEQAAAGFGQAMRRQMEAAWASCWAVFDQPAAEREAAPPPAAPAGRDPAAPPRQGH